MHAIHTLPLRLTADPSRVVVRPFHLGWQATGAAPSRSRRIVDAVLALDEQMVADELALVMRDFEARHWQTQKVFLTRCDEVATMLALDTGPLSTARRQLIGAYFCHEYSYAAAALMNPSVVPHVDQSGLGKESVRIVLSLRAVGEGHISSVAFREGILGPEGTLQLAPQPPFATAADAHSPEETLQEGPVCVYRHADSTLSGTVLFPITPAQTNGLEDLRLLRFEHDDGSHEWLGTYTAYNGREIRSEMLSTRDFRSFHLTPLTGRAARNKGMGLFPRKIDGRYLMIGRQDGENLYLIASDTLTHWDEGELLLTPKYSWELLQIGNCGAPIELDEGWLVLTHGVGAMRKYSIGAVLLDKTDPSRVLGRTSAPLLAASEEDREGYVPNVVYTCGALRHGDCIFMPYGIADSTVAFGFMRIPDLLATLS
ncbi:glycoside hydrolase family 130 protein [Sphingosinicella sp.]|uniref:glycoside hydrolase family 130 protein n=1 Tax=Sphingosinicella sp. TaxID=1917971 RepID=UPI001844FBC1|nr:glycoside hydrolase family 130 protein [Sphingosinicella sp.]MBA4758897.1 glycosidase [Sphingosinicella sp.]